MHGRRRSTVPGWMAVSLPAVPNVGVAGVAPAAAAPGAIVLGSVTDVDGVVLPGVTIAVKSRETVLGGA